MHALDLIAHWPVDRVDAAVVVVPVDGATRVDTRGDPRHSYRIASLSKPLAAWAALVAMEEGLVTLDQPIGQPGCTLRHLLAHAGGYSFDGPVPVAAPGTRRIYSNTGIELAAAAVAAAAEMPFTQYLAEAVFQPLGMTDSELRGSPAHQVWSRSVPRCSRLPRWTWRPLRCFPIYAAWYPASGRTRGVRGGSASRSTATSGRTGWAHATRPERSAISEAQAR
jgi:CubicO group peptidase (beta-lactamase class C family)